MTDIQSYWEEDLVAFLLGCSFTFEQALLGNGIPVRHIEEKRNVPMYRTNIPCVPAGRFKGPMVVSMRPIPERDVVRAVQVTSRFPAVHGAPVQIGNPEAIGIRDLSRPDFGDPVDHPEGRGSRLLGLRRHPPGGGDGSEARFHDHPRPGHMFITDLRDEQFGVM